MTRLIIVRHGQALCNIDRTIEGRATCRGLTDLGRDQAGLLRDRFAYEQLAVDQIVASPIRRARQTAEILAELLQRPITFDADLEEVRPGEAEGMTWDQYFAFYGMTEGWQPNVAFAPGAEAWTEFAARVSGAIDRISRTYSGQSCLIVAHGGVVDASLFHFFGLDPQLQPPIDFETSNTSITEWERRTFTALRDPLVHPAEPASEVHRWRLVRYNDAAHLRAAPYPPFDAPVTPKQTPSLSTP